MTALKNPSAFLITGKREFAIPARLNGWTVCVIPKPEHTEVIGGGRVAIHMTVFDSGDGTKIGVKGANLVTEDNNPGAEVPMDEAVIAALSDQYYGDRMSDIVSAMIDEAGGPEEILVWLEEAGRMGEPDLESLLRSLGVDLHG